MLLNGIQADLKIQVAHTVLLFLDVGSEVSPLSGKVSRVFCNEGAYFVSFKIPLLATACKTLILQL